jgi:predicted transcriptional regulator
MPQVSIGPDVSAIEAMVLMNEQQISAVAVVDGVGKIIGNFSVSEMRCVARAGAGCVWGGAHASQPWARSQPGGD